MATSTDLSMRIKFSPCMCWHANGQIMDAALQFLLPERGIIPCPFKDMLNMCREENEYEKNREAENEENGETEETENGELEDVDMKATESEDAKDERKGNKRSVGSGSYGEDISMEDEPEIEMVSSSHAQEHRPWFPKPVVRVKASRRAFQSVSRGNSSSRGGAQMIVRHRETKEDVFRKNRWEFCPVFRKLQYMFVDLFRSKLKGQVLECFIALGPSPVRYDEFFRFSWPTSCCSAEYECRCSHGRPVSDREFSHVGCTMLGGLSSLKPTKFVGGNRRVFVWIYADCDADLPAHFQEDSTFEPPSDALCQKTKLKHASIQIVHKNCLPGSIPDTERTWFRLDYHLQGFK